jgi:hypothetical protein
MKTVSLVLAALALSAAAVPALAQPSMQTVFRAGNWFVVRSNQPATQSVACTGFYVGEGDVQLSKDKLTIKLPGEVRSVSLRIGDQPAGAPRAINESERQTGALVVAGADFDRVRRSKTLTVDLATAQGSETRKLDLDGLAATLKNIEAGCPVPAAAARAERARQQARAQARAARCTPEALEDQRARGVPEWRIAARCPQAAAPAQR